MHEKPAQIVRSSLLTNRRIGFTVAGNTKRVPMNYRHQIQGRYFLVVLFFLNIMVLLPVLFIIKDPTPYERVAVAGMWAYMTLHGGDVLVSLGHPAGAAIHVQPVSELFVSSAEW